MVICRHRRRTLEPAADEEWPLTDHPVLTLNFYDPGRYDFGAGWDLKGSEFILPVSPRLAVFTQVGSRDRGHLVLTPERTQELRRMMVERPCDGSQRGNQHRGFRRLGPEWWMMPLLPRSNRLGETGMPHTSTMKHGFESREHRRRPPDSIKDSETWRSRGRCNLVEMVDRALQLIVHSIPERFSRNRFLDPWSDAAPSRFVPFPCVVGGDWKRDAVSDAT